MLCVIGLSVFFSAELHFLPKPAYPGAGILITFILSGTISLVCLSAIVGIKNVMKRGT